MTPDYTKPLLIAVLWFVVAAISLWFGVSWLAEALVFGGAILALMTGAAWLINEKRHIVSDGDNR